MNLHSATVALRRHAGLTDSIHGDNSVGLVDHLWEIRKGCGCFPIEQDLGEILASLQAVNQSLNGSLPSESTSKVSEIPRAIAASVSGMSIAILETMHQIEAVRPAERELLRDLRRLMWKIDCGWNAVLAGDIDDIQEHVQLEGAAREVL